MSSVINTGSVSTRLRKLRQVRSMTFTSKFRVRTLSFEPAPVTEQIQNESERPSLAALLNIVPEIQNFGVPGCLGVRHKRVKRRGGSGPVIHLSISRTENILRTKAA